MLRSSVPYPTLRETPTQPHNTGKSQIRSMKIVSKNDSCGNPLKGKGWLSERYPSSASSVLRQEGDQRLRSLKHAHEPTGYCLGVQRNLGLTTSGNNKRQSETRIAAAEVRKHPHKLYWAVCHMVSALYIIYLSCHREARGKQWIVTTNKDITGKSRKQITNKICRAKFIVRQKQVSDGKLTWGK